MNRRQMLCAGFAALLPTPGWPRSGRTRWILSQSEGLDALCFLGPLAGKPLYTRFYAEQAAAIRPRFPQAALSALDALQAAADARGVLLAPMLCVLFSGGAHATLAGLIGDLDAAEARLLGPYRVSPHWSEETWAGFMRARPLLRTVLAGLAEADFPRLRRDYLGAKVAERTPVLSERLAGADVIAEQERLIGRALQPELEVVLMAFCKPHGIRVQGQRFLTAVDYPDETILRNAAHEVLHPPFAMDGPAAQAALEVLGADDLITRIVAEHDPSFGYNSLEGLLNEDTVQALDQIVSERLGFARPAANRWRTADGGMHVLAAGLYGLFKAEGYDRTGGDLEAWMLTAARGGKLAPASLHAAAARVLETTPDRLWPAKAA